MTLKIYQHISYHLAVEKLGHADNNIKQKIWITEPQKNIDLPLSLGQLDWQDNSQRRSFDVVTLSNIGKSRSESLLPTQSSCFRWRGTFQHLTSHIGNIRLTSLGLELKQPSGRRTWIDWSYKLHVFIVSSNLWRCSDFEKKVLQNQIKTG